LKVLASDSNYSSSLRVSDIDGDRRDGSSSFWGYKRNGYIFQRVEDLDMPAWLNIEQVWTTQLMFLELLREREKKRWGLKKEDES
jgi:hypothetical protein